jgi:tRNA(fMet)-specific endonuclease VapC
MDGEFLLDTNTVIRLFAHDEAVERRFDANPRILLPVVVLGELYYGAIKSSLVDENCRRIDDFLGRVEVLDATLGTAYDYGMIKTELASKGRMIPENDLWIAAFARQHALTLVSSDRHFAEVDDLLVEQW